MSSPTSDDRIEINILERLRKLKMSGMADSLEKQFQDPNTDLIPFTQRLEKAVDAEWELRHTKKLNKLLKNAGLRYPNADIDESIHDPARKLDAAIIERLATCEWIDEGKNLIVTGMTSSGKTYISNALCVSALQKLKTVKYVKASTLMLELEQARLKATYLDVINSITKLDLLAVDDFGLMELDVDKCRDLFEVIDSRDGRKSTIIISQYPVKNWYDLFANHTYADAILARITDKRHCYRLEMNGISMRDPN